MRWVLLGPVAGLAVACQANPAYLGLDGSGDVGGSAVTTSPATGGAGTDAGGSGSGQGTGNASGATTGNGTSSGDAGSGTAGPMLQCGVAPTDLCFGPRVDMPTHPGTPAGIDAADFDGDGDVDVVLTHETSDAVELFLNDGVGSLTRTNLTFNPGSGPVAVAFGELNSQAPLDVVTADRDGQGVTVFVGAGSDQLGLLGSFSAGDRCEDVAVGHFDGNSNLDVAAAVYGTDEVMLFQSSGSGLLTQVANFQVLGQPEALVAADLDADGRMDAVAAGHGGNGFSVLLGDGDMSMQVTDFDYGTHHTGVAVADLDADGRLDIMAARHQTAEVVAHWGDGTGMVDSGHVELVEGDPGAIATGDLNGDGLVDAVVADLAQDQVVVLAGIGGRDFTAVPLAVAGAPWRIEVADLNGDGFDDIAVTIPGNDEIALFLSEPKL